MIAQLTRVTKRYGPVTALADIDLDINRGELLSVLGPNGAGKTTAVRLLLGLASPNHGSVRVFGQDPRDYSARTRVGAMLQVAKVPEMLRVREHIHLFSSYYPHPMLLPDVLRAAGLEDIAARKFSDLSGGQRQRVMFALAICGNPDLLFLDEPTAGLDVESRRAMWRHIRGFVSRGGSVLLTTHYLEEADALADRIVVIDHGRVAATGTPSEIKQRVAARRIRCVSALPVEAISQIPGVISVRVDGRAVEIVAAQSEDVLRRLLAADPYLSDLEVTGAGLEDAFLAITNHSVPAPTQEAAQQ